MRKHRDSTYSPANVDLWLRCTSDLIKLPSEHSRSWETAGKWILERQRRGFEVWTLVVRMRGEWNTSECSVVTGVDIGDFTYYQIVGWRLPFFCLIPVNSFNQGLPMEHVPLVSTTEELLGRKISSSVLENRKCGRKDPLCWPRKTLYPKKLALTSLTSGGRSVGIFRSRTKATELRIILMWAIC
jgi:hypothetical protein